MWNLFLRLTLLIGWRCGIGSGLTTTGEMYSSLAYINDLFHFDKLVGSAIALLPDDEYKVTNYLDQYVHLLLDINQETEEQLTPHLTGNPLHVYSLIKRLVLYWPGVKRNLDRFFDNEKNNNPYLKSKIQYIINVEKTTVLPGLGDLRGAANALGRLQKFYRLSLEELVEGKIFHVVCSVRLTTFDCLRIGNISINEGSYSSGWLWYNQAYIMTSDIEYKQYINDLIEGLATEHDSKWVENNSQYFPSPLQGNRTQIYYDEIYYQLCRGLDLIDPNVKSKLKCYLTTQGSPFLLIQPVQIEEIHHNPKLVMVYNVIHDGEINQLKHHSRDILVRSTVVDGSEVPDVRVSHTAWLSETELPIVQKLSHRIAQITGLHTHEGDITHMAGEKLQILSYGIGGHYAHHVDYFFKNHILDEDIPDLHRIPGDRLATWMFYLSDVEMGGRTAFIHARVSTSPVKGAAVFWFNILPNGRADPMSEHGGCPTLLGHKWVANKWIRENENFLRHPCPLKPPE